MKSFTSGEFSQDVSAAKCAAQDGPVFITERGEPAFVLLSIDDYQALTVGGQSLQQVFSQLPNTDAIDAEFPTAKGNVARAAKLPD